MAQNPDTPTSERMGSISPPDVTSVGSLTAPAAPPSASFATKVRKSARQKPPLIADSKDLHEIYAHINKETLKHLSDNVTGILITDESIVPQCITDCECYALSKMTRQVSRYPERSAPVTMPSERIAFDWIHHDEGYNNDWYSSHTLCTLARFNLTASHSKKSSFREVFVEHLNIIELNWGFKVKYVQTDDFKDDAFDHELRIRGIIREASTPDTQAQNGKAERAGRSITTVSRCLIETAGSPPNMWPVTMPYAATLLN